MVFLHFSCQLGGEKFKETLSSFLASFADRAAFSLRLPCPTSLKETDVFPTPSLPRKRFIPKGYTESRYVAGGGRGESEAQGNSEFSQYPGLGVSLPTLSYRLDTRRPGEKEGGKEGAPGARRALAPLTRAPASPVPKAGNGLFITCFSCSHFLGTSDQQEFAPHASFLREKLCKEVIHWEEPWIPGVLEGASGPRMCGRHSQPRLGVPWFSQGICAARH